MADKKNLVEQINTAQNIAICVGANDTALSVGISIAMFIKDRFGKEPNVVYTGDISPIDAYYSDYWTVKDTLANKTVRITIDHKNTDVSAIEWERTDDDRFILNLKSVNKGFSTDRVKTQIVGENFDCIICVGIPDIARSKTFYSKNKADFESTLVVNIDNDAHNKMYGEINIVDKQAETLVSLILKMFARWNYTPSAKVSEVLLKAIHQENIIKEVLPENENLGPDVNASIQIVNAK